MKVIFLSIINRSYHQTITLSNILVVLFVFNFVHLPKKGGRTQQGPFKNTVWNLLYCLRDALSNIYVLKSQFYTSLTLIEPQNSHLQICETIIVNS
jgi:hypothetical protein